MHKQCHTSAQLSDSCRESGFGTFPHSGQYQMFYDQTRREQEVDRQDLGKLGRSELYSQPDCVLQLSHPHSNWKNKSD